VKIFVDNLNLDPVDHRTGKISHRPVDGSNISLAMRDRNESRKCENDRSEPPQHVIAFGVVRSTALDEHVCRRRFDGHVAPKSNLVSMPVIGEESEGTEDPCTGIFPMQFAQHGIMFCFHFGLWVTAFHCRAETRVRQSL
jgi:hypothetical protein